MTYARERKAHQKKKQRRRERKITWYNPPYNRNVKTKIGKKFIQLINQHFPPGSKLRKIFNPNTVKLSYSCTLNVAAIIKRHNNRICNPPPTEDPATKHCNCRGGVETCPLKGECLSKGVVYEAKVSPEGARRAMVYVGSTATTFKERSENHKTTLKHENKARHTRLSKHAWELKRSSIEHKIEWRILHRAKEYSSLTKRCNLCLAEKLAIMTADKRTRLNVRSEISSQCRHVRKHSLANFEPPIR